MASSIFPSPPHPDKDLPLGAPPGGTPICMENAIKFGFRLAMGASAWFAILSIVGWILAAIFSHH